LKGAAIASLLLLAAPVLAEEVDWGVHEEAPVPAATAPEPTPAEEAAPRREGIASWYGLPFHGRRTASGERFDMNAFTAAHPSLPFGTHVRVQNPGNGRSVVVRINDRGPHTGGRIIDLSHAAARALGMLGRGTRRVVLHWPAEPGPR